MWVSKRIKSFIAVHATHVTWIAFGVSVGRTSLLADIFSIYISFEDEENPRLPYILFLIELIIILLEIFIWKSDFFFFKQKYFFLNKNKSKHFS